MTGLNLRALLGSLHDHDVRYVLIGGVAVGAHGYIRATVDADIVPDPDPDNLRRLGNALVSINATLPLSGDAPFRHAQHGPALLRSRNITLATRFGDLDIIQWADGVPSFAALDDRALDSALLGVPVRVCALGDLRAMKQAAGRTVDRLDLENLPLG